MQEVNPVWGVVTDASPRGIGGMLIHKVGDAWHIMEAFEAPIQAHQAAALEIQFMEASGQAVLEGLAVLRALQLWAAKFAENGNRHQKRQHSRTGNVKETVVTYKDAELHSSRDSPAH